MAIILSFHFDYWKVYVRNVICKASLSIIRFWCVLEKTIAAIKSFEYFRHLLEAAEPELSIKLKGSPCCFKLHHLSPSGRCQCTIHQRKITRRLIKLTLTRASVKFVHIAISSRVLMSGYRLRLNVCSSSWSCCDVKCVLWRRWRLFFLSFFGSSAVIESSAFSCFTCVSLSRDAADKRKWKSVTCVKCLQTTNVTLEIEAA